MIKLLSILKVSLVAALLLLACNAFAGYYTVYESPYVETYETPPCGGCVVQRHVCNTCQRPRVYHHYRHHYRRHYYHARCGCRSIESGGMFEVSSYSWQQVPNCSDRWVVGCNGRGGSWVSPRRRGDIMYSEPEVFEYYNAPSIDTDTSDGGDY